MTKRQWMGVLSVATAGVAFAQTPVPAERGGVFTMAVPAPAGGVQGNIGGQGNIVYRQGALASPAGATFQFISSENFDGSVVKNAPYSAEAVTETTQRLADGNRISSKTTATVYRDSEGRTRREGTIGAIGPWASNSEPLQTISINDPVAGTNLFLDVRSKTVRKMGNSGAGGPQPPTFVSSGTYAGETGSVPQFLAFSKSLGDNVKNESLGPKPSRGSARRARA